MACWPISRDERPSPVDQSGETTDERRRSTAEGLEAGVDPDGLAELRRVDHRAVRGVGGTEDAGRARTIHVKDWGGEPDSVIGEGIADWPLFFELAETLHDPEWYVVEEGSKDGFGLTNKAKAYFQPLIEGEVQSRKKVIYESGKMQMVAKKLRAWP